jgi:TonB-dependent SusC/RagA subfamily outer membrane receptor
MKLKRPVPAWLSILFFALLCMIAGFSDEDARLLRIREALNKFSYVYQQQKAYLHLDRSEYRGGEVIYVKAYLLNGMNHQPDTLSTNLYVELISPFLNRVEIKRLQMFRGFGLGDFHLSDTLPEGLYQIRAYTNWMQNFDGEFYFEKNFTLVNPAYSKLISPRQAKNNQKELENREKIAGDIDLQFMAEGGEMVAGIENTVAFKAINPLGKGIEIGGDIVDDQGNTVTAFKSFYKGMGRFALTPEKGRKYFAVVKNGDHDLRVGLPIALETGMVMHVDDEPGNLKVDLHSNHPGTADRTANEVILVGQTGGRIYYQEILTLQKGLAQVSIKKTLFPSGIMQLTAFSGRGLPLAERLVFINRLDNMRIRFSATDTAVEEGTKLLFSIQVTDKTNKPLVSNLSLSFTREKSTQKPANNDNLVSNMLLTSDLKGFVEDPGDYFAENSPFLRQAMDNLMLTNGWRRFDWSEILAGKYPTVRFHEERGIAVFGQITRDFFNIPLKNCKVQMSILSSYNDVFTTASSDKGFFMFDSMVYYDTIKVKIEAWRPNGRRNLIIVIPDEKVNEVSGFHGDYSLITQSERDNRQFRLERAADYSEAYNKEQERIKEEEKDQPRSLYNTPDFVLRSKDIPRGNQNILEILKGRVAGLNIYGDQIMIRGPNTIMGSTQPLFLIDGIPTHDIEAVKAIPVEDIDRIEVLKGPSAAIFGINGANGVIAIYTKRGHYVRRGVIEFDMLGYCAPRKFYQPKYVPANEPVSNYTVLWQPVIITDPGGKATLVLDKPAIQGDYRVVIEGISYEGHVGSISEVMSNE